MFPVLLAAIALALAAAWLFAAWKRRARTRRPRKAVRRPPIRRAPPKAPLPRLSPLPRRPPPTRRTTPNPPSPPLPDTPSSFGYKCSWLSVRSTSSEAVRDALPLLDAVPCAFGYGVYAAYEGDTFVSPPIDGWVFVVSISLPDIERGLQPLVERLSRELDTTVLGFGTHRIVEYHAWARAERGTIVRAYGWLGERGEALADVGEPLAGEREALPEGRSPNEGTVMKVAGAWSLDPQTLEERAEEGLGWLGAPLAER